MNRPTYLSVEEYKAKYGTEPYIPPEDSISAKADSKSQSRKVVPSRIRSKPTPISSPLDREQLINSTSSVPTYANNGGTPLYLPEPEEDDETPSSPSPEVPGQIEQVPVPKKQIVISNPIPRTGYEAAMNGSQLPEDRRHLQQLLNVKWSEYIPHQPYPKQLAALMLGHVRELLFGGAAGGGKSDWLLMENLRFCDLPGFSGIVFRRQLTDLKQSGGLIPRCAEWLGPHVDAGKCRYAADEHKWYFKTRWPGTDIPGPDAIFQFGYIGEATIRERYMSAEYNRVNFEELAQWPDDVDYLFMNSRIRKNVCLIHKTDSKGDPIYVKGCRYCDTLSQIPLGLRSASNPGPAWIKRRFGIIPDPTQYPNRHAALVAISEGAKIRWVGTNSDCPFIPSYVDDNKALNANEYRKMLRNLPEHERSRFEDGNWESRRNSRFKRHWQKFIRLHVPEAMLHSETPLFRYEEDGTRTPLHYDINDYSYSYVDIDRQGNTSISEPIPFRTLSTIFTTNDPAVTSKKGPADEGRTSDKHSNGVIATWGQTKDNHLLWLNNKRFRKEIPEFVQSVIDTNIIYKPRYNKVECNGVGVGVAQYLERAGIPVRKTYRKTDKVENSLSAQMLMSNGFIFFPDNAYWAEEAEDEVFQWTGLEAEDDDIVDALSDAAPEIALSVARKISSPTASRVVSRPRAVPTMRTGLTYGNKGSIPRYGIR